MTKDEALALALEALEWEECNKGYKNAQRTAIAAIKQALAAQPEQEHNFCQRCGKRTNDIHTCTPPATPVQEPVAWMTINAYGEEDDIHYENPEGHLLEGWTYKPLYEYPQQTKQEPVKLRRGDVLRCIETDELCTVWATSTTGKTLVKWSANNFGDYTAEQIGELFWIEPAPVLEPAGCACRWNDEGDRTVTCERHQGWLEVIAEWADRAREAEAKLKAIPPTAAEIGKEMK